MDDKIMNEVLRLIAHSAENDLTYELTLLLQKLPEGTLEDFISNYKIEVFDNLDLESM